jgi:hypothetical protein
VEEHEVGGLSDSEDGQGKSMKELRSQLEDENEGVREENYTKKKKRQHKGLMSSLKRTLKKAVHLNHHHHHGLDDKDESVEGIGEHDSSTTVTADGVAHNGGNVGIGIMGGEPQPLSVSFLDDEGRELLPPTAGGREIVSGAAQAAEPGYGKPGAVAALAKAKHFGSPSPNISSVTLHNRGSGVGYGNDFINSNTIASRRGSNASHYNTKNGNGADRDSKCGCGTPHAALTPIHDSTYPIDFEGLKNRLYSNSRNVDGGKFFVEFQVGKRKVTGEFKNIQAFSCMK